MENSPIKIIDLFAGPGGLGEGFSSFKKDGKFPFRISLSVEMEYSAWKTLRLRSFVRQFTQNNQPIPEEYYDYLAGKLGKDPEEKLFIKFEKQANAAREEALQLNQRVQTRSKMKTTNFFPIIQGSISR